MRPLTILALACICGVCWYVAFCYHLHFMAGCLALAAVTGVAVRVQDWNEERRKRKDWPRATAMWGN